MAGTISSPATNPTTAGPKVLRGIFRKRRDLLTHLFHTAVTALQETFRTLVLESS